MCSVLEKLVRETYIVEILHTHDAFISIIETIPRWWERLEFHISYYVGGKAIICVNNKCYYLFDREKGFL